MRNNSTKYKLIDLFNISIAKLFFDTTLNNYINNIWRNSDKYLIIHDSNSKFEVDNKLMNLNNLITLYSIYDWIINI